MTIYLYIHIYSTPISIYSPYIYSTHSVPLYILYISYITHTSLCITSAEGDLSLRDKHLSVVFSLRSKPNKQFNISFLWEKILHSYIYNTCRVFYKPTPEHTVLKIRFRHMFAFIYYNTCKNVTKPTSLTHYKKAPVGSFFYIYILYILAKFCTNRLPVPSIILLPNK